MGSESEDSEMVMLKKYQQTVGIYDIIIYVNYESTFNHPFPHMPFC